MDAVQIFVPGIGQFDNIGDVILRRQLLDWLRPLGRLHIYIGKAPRGYADGLRLSDEDRVYASFGRWYLTGSRAAIRGPARYVFKPGEVRLTARGLKESVGLFPLVALIRARGGRSVSVGAGAHNLAAVPRLLMRPSIALTSMTAWRDQASADYMGAGCSMPDLAFGEGVADVPIPAAVRDVAAVSMRGDRPYPSHDWVQAVRAVGRNQGYALCVVTQVHRDADRSRQLATELGADLVDWDGRAHDGQEAKLRDLYGRCAVAVSDRLHVLIAAYTEGAVPVAPLTDNSTKVARHFEAAGVADIAFPSSGLSADQIAESIESVLGRRDAVIGALPHIREQLAQVRGAMTSALAVGDRRGSRWLRPELNPAA